MVTPKSSQAELVDAPKVNIAFALTPEPCVVVKISSVTKLIAGVLTSGKTENPFTSNISVAKSEYTPSLFFALIATKY